MPVRQTEENMNYSFNLIDKPWIWVLKKNGNTELVSLRYLYDKAEDIYSLSNENIYVNSSIFLILKTILDVSYSRNEKTRSMTNENFIYDKSVILKYLDSVHHLFDIYDPEHPFLQIKYNSDKLRKGEGDIYSIDPFYSENKKSSWSLYYTYTDDWVARQLLTYRFWHVGVNGGSTGKRIEPSFLNEKFCLIFPVGDSLHITFRLNFNSINLNKSLHPLWEESVEANEPYIDTLKVSIKDKEYYNAIQYNEEVDIARILTYSNI
jgi:hypothetical protein